MSNSEKLRSCASSGVISWVVGLIFGTIIGILFSFLLIRNMLTAVWIALGLGVIAFILVFIAALISSVNMCVVLGKCLRGHISCLIAGIIGTIIFGIILLSVALNPLFILVRILVAIAAFFFGVMVTELVLLILCLSDALRLR